ncbi:MAG: hypothetical protein GX160_07065 [Clostridiales bacterium]|nr:hypothetical protein [Clostridiales bacterium]
MEKRDIPPGFTYARPSQRNPIPIVWLILLVSPYIKRYKASTVLEESEINTFDDSDTILDMLSSIYPYLDLEYQDGINFIFGLAEVKAILNSLLRGTYYKFSRLDTGIQPMSPQERVIGIIRSLQPYIPLENQAHINRILDTFSSAKELIYRLNKFKHQSLEVQNSNKNNLEKAMELIDIIKLLIPREQQHNISKISNILRMVETVELAQLLKSPEEDAMPTTTENKIVANTEENITSSSDPDIESDKKPMDLEAISHSLKSMMKPEQAKSLDLIMKMAQLLAQDSTEKESAD